MNNKLENIKGKLSSVSLIIFPILLLVGFSLHPDLLQFKIVKTGEELLNNFRNSYMFHIGHIIVLISVPFIIAVHVFFMKIMNKNGEIFGFIGGIVGIFGAVILAADKGALCLVLSAFDTMNDNEIKLIIPALQSMVDKKGLLIVLWLLPLLPIGAIIQAIGLRIEKYINKFQLILIITGLLLLNNPDIEIISSIGSILIIIGYLPLGIKLFLNK